MLLLLAPGAFAAAPAFDATVTAAAHEFHVPRDLVVAIGWEATHLDPDAVTRWGGWGMYDLREGDQDPSLEHASALLSVNPNTMAKDWHLATRGVAAVLAEHALAANGGVLPAVDDLMAWKSAVIAFSGRQEPNLQDLYADTIFAMVRDGRVMDTRWGSVVIYPHAIDLGPDGPPPPPPTSPDSSLAYTFSAACSDNYSDYSRGSGDIDMVVIHTMEGSYSGSISWFQNCSAEASAHYMVRSSDGQITQMVKEEDVAWHAGNWDYNTRSVGIEHEGYTSDCSYYTDALYTASAALTADIAAREGVSLDRSHIIGHSEVPDPDGSGWGGSGHHTDPGDCWDWDYYMSLVEGGTGSSGGEIIGVVADSDIYNGTRLVGATVWIGETGETTTVSSDGYYRFEDVPWGTYTMHATYPGYDEGTCSKTTSGDQDWCSIALVPSSSSGGGGGGGAADTGTPDTGGGTGGGGDTATDDTGPTAPPSSGASGPGVMTALGEVGGGCGGCATTGDGGGVGLLGLAALVATRRRR